MIVMLNGSFGVGKSTVAKLLRRAIPGSVVYDPEWAGSVLMRLPRGMFEGSGTDDFQDIVLWRKSIVAGVKLFRLAASGPIIVPMTFSNRHYFDEVVDGIRKNDSTTHLYCLRAPLAVLTERLSRRIIGSDEMAWVTRRNIECARAHRDPHFGEPIETEGRSPIQVTELIMGRLQGKKKTLQSPGEIENTNFN